MILDARELTTNQELQADVCIVGAGAAGITLALDLSGAGHRVLLLEAGGTQIEDAQQTLYKAPVNGEQTWKAEECRFRGLGGSTLAWAGWCRPLEPEDFAPPEPISGMAWPLDFETLLPWYRRASMTCKAGPYVFDAQRVSEIAGKPLLNVDPQRAHNVLYQYSNPPLRFGAHYASELQAAQDIEVYLHANITRVVLTQDRVDHLEGRTLQGNAFTVQAQRYVLATGGLENARLLMASGAAGGSGALGRFFMEHPHYYNSATIVLDDPGDMSLYGGTVVALPDDESGLTVPTLVRTALGVNASVRQRHGLVGFGAELRPHPDGPGDTGALNAATIESLMARADHRYWRLSCRVEQTPSGDNRLRLLEDRDAVGMPKATIDWAVSPFDRRSLAEALKVLGAELGRAGLGRMWIPTDDAGEFAWRAQAGCHHMGTTRMSASPDDGVVDDQGRCHEHSNLFIAGSSTFVTGGFANPTLTIVALAHRMAQTLLAEL